MRKSAIASGLAIVALALAGSSFNLSAQSTTTPQVGWQQATLSLVEGAQVQRVSLVAFRTVDGVRVSTGELTVPFTISGNATADVDFQLDPADAIVFLDGRDAAPVRIAIVDDALHEPAPDTLFLHLTAGDGYTLDPARTTLRVLLSDNDPAGNPVPAITSVTRDASAKGKSVVLQVRGTGFITSSTVRFAGEPVPTTFVSATELRADISKKVANAARDASVALTVFNPAPGGGEAAAHQFTLSR